MKIIQSEQEFNELMKNELVVVDYYAEWCPPCKMLGPILEKISSEFPNITFIKVNTDNFPSLAAKAHIEFLPTVMFYKGGILVNKFVGYRDEKGVKEALKSLL